MYIYIYIVHIYMRACDPFFIFCAFPITAAALYYSTSYPPGYFICIILCKYVSLHCAMHLKGFPGRWQILSFDGSRCDERLSFLDNDLLNLDMTLSIVLFEQCTFCRYKICQISDIILLLLNRCCKCLKRRIKPKIVME